jgi:hypothetical protein
MSTKCVEKTIVNLWDRSRGSIELPGVRDPIQSGRGVKLPSSKHLIVEREKIIVPLTELARRMVLNFGFIDITVTT